MLEDNEEKLTLPITARDQINNIATSGRVTFLASIKHPTAGYLVPKGIVTIWKEGINPLAVGFDIGCGITFATAKGVSPAKVRSLQAHLAKQIQVVAGCSLSFVSKGDNTTANVVELRKKSTVLDTAWDQLPILKKLKSGAAKQFARLGKGEHFANVVEVIRPEGTSVEDEPGDVKIVVHNGSRGLGTGITQHFLRAGCKEQKLSILQFPVLKDESELALQYVLCHNLAVKYAQQSRKLILEKIGEILGVSALLNIVDQPHNILEYEGQLGCYVHRKGVQMLRACTIGYVASSWADTSVIVHCKPGLKNGGLSQYMCPVGTGHSDMNKLVSVIDPRSAGESVATSGVNSLHRADSYRRLAQIVPDLSTSSLECTSFYKNIVSVMRGSHV